MKNNKIYSGMFSELFVIAIVVGIMFNNGVGYIRLNSFSQAAQPTAQRANQTPMQMQQIRQYLNVGRNDLCPCGSGNKYKRCHGRAE